MVAWRSLEVALERCLVAELVRAHATPVLVRVIGDVAICLGRARDISLLRARSNEGGVVLVTDNGRR